jgi:putative ABC transport system permease protein
MSKIARLITQSLVLLSIGLRASRFNPVPPAVAVVGIVCAVGTLIAMLSMGAGVRTSALSGARNDRAVITAHDAASASGGTLSVENVLAIRDLPGIKRQSDGTPYAVAEAVMHSYSRRRSDNARVHREVRGVSGELFDVYPEMKISRGRVYKTGVNEVIVGESFKQSDSELEIGDTIRFFGADLQIVGLFDSPGIRKGDIVGDSIHLLSLARSSYFNRVTVVLDSPSAFDTLRKAATKSPLLQVDVWHERDFLERAVRPIFRLLDVMSYLIGSVMAIGATLGAAIALYAAMDIRRRQLATLMAIGYRSDALGIAVLLEATLLATVGAVLALALSLYAFNGIGVAPLGTPITLVVTAGIGAIAIGWAIAIGLIGACFPMLQVTRSAIATALRAQ